jgi:hypothetical protein
MAAICAIETGRVDLLSPLPMNCRFPRRNATHTRCCQCQKFAYSGLLSSSCRRMFDHTRCDLEPGTHISRVDKLRPVRADAAKNTSMKVRRRAIGLQPHCAVDARSNGLRGARRAWIGSCELRSSFHLARASIQACRQILEASPRASTRTVTESRSATQSAKRRPTLAQHSAS